MSVVYPRAYYHSIFRTTSGPRLEENKDFFKWPKGVFLITPSLLIVTQYLGILLIANTVAVEVSLFSAV